MNLPAWLADHVDELGTARLAGDVTRAQAVTSLRAAIAAKDDRALIDGVLAAFAAKVLDSWHRAHIHPPAPGPLAEVQSELFPQLPARLYVAPAAAKALMLCNAHDWDMARNVLENRTRSAIEGAREDWQQFEAAYARVRPLLAGDLTTADVAAELRGELATGTP